MKSRYLSQNEFKVSEGVVYYFKENFFIVVFVCVHVRGYVSCELGDRVL